MLEKLTPKTPIEREPFGKHIVKAVEKQLKKVSCSNVELDLDSEAMAMLINLSTEYNTTVSVIVNVLLRNYMVALLKDEELQNGTFSKVLDSYEFIEFLKKGKEIIDPILIIDYMNQENKVVALSTDMYDSLKGVEGQELINFENIKNV